MYFDIFLPNESYLLRNTRKIIWEINLLGYITLKFSKVPCGYVCEDIPKHSAASEK